jgi:hypothetical protein
LRGHHKAQLQLVRRTMFAICLVRALTGRWGSLHIAAFGE